MIYCEEDWKNPDFENPAICHDWKNYVSEEVSEIWHSFTDEQKEKLAHNFDYMADLEEWD